MSQPERRADSKIRSANVHARDGCGQVLSTCSGRHARTAIASAESRSTKSAERSGRFRRVVGIEHRDANSGISSKILWRRHVSRSIDQGRPASRDTPCFLAATNGVAGSVWLCGRRIQWGDLSISATRFRSPVRSHWSRSITAESPSRCRFRDPWSRPVPRGRDARRCEPTRCTRGRCRACEGGDENGVDDGEVESARDERWRGGGVEPASHVAQSDALRREERGHRSAAQVGGAVAESELGALRVVGHAVWSPGRCEPAALPQLAPGRLAERGARGDRRDPHR